MSIRWTEVTKGREYRVESPIGEYVVERFEDPHTVWAVTDCDEDAVIYHGTTFERCLSAIRFVAEEALT